MDAVAFTARQRTDLLLLVAALEVERRAIAARIHFLLAEQNQLVAAGYFLPHRLLAVEIVARLVHIAEMHALADGDAALVGCLLLGDHPEQRGFAGAVGTDHADDAARRKLEGEVVDQLTVAETFAEAFEVDHVLTKTLGDRNRDLRR